MQWEKRWGNFNWQNNMLVGICKALTTFIDATNAFSCYICSYKNKPSSTYFTNTYMVLDHFHEKFIVCYTKQRSQRQHQLLLILNLIGATKNKWKLLISIWERLKGNLYSKEKRLKLIISPQTRRWRVWKQRTLHIHLHQIKG